MFATFGTLPLHGWITRYVLMQCQAKSQYVRGGGEAWLLLASFDALRKGERGRTATDSIWVYTSYRISGTLICPM